MHQEGGFTKHHRQKWIKGYHKDHLLWVMMDYFIDFAHFKDGEVFYKKFGKVSLKRGQVVFAERGLAEFLGVTRKQIRSRIATMENMDFLSLERDRRWTLATVVNYDLYQNKGTTNGTDVGTTGGPPEAQYNKKGKKVKKKNIIKIAGKEVDIWCEPPGPIPDILLTNMPKVFYEYATTHHKWDKKKIMSEYKDFQTYWEQRSHKKSTFKKDWQRTWEKWCENDTKWQAKTDKEQRVVQPKFWGTPQDIEDYKNAGPAY